jgi:Ca-activated chloride channel family protein
MNSDRPTFASVVAVTVVLIGTALTAYALIRYDDFFRHSFAHRHLLWLYPALQGLTLLGIFAARRRRRVLAQLGRLPALAALTARRVPWRRTRGLCWFLGITALLLGLAGPQWGREAEPITAPGRDLVVVLDVSGSMLADDVSPSRQERAKQALRELIDWLQKRGGNRVALVAFAARADILCPLTHDYGHFLEKLDELDAAHLPLELRPPSEHAVSGTRIGEGLKAALRAHDLRDERKGFQDVLLLSDGDDPMDRLSPAQEEWLGPLKEGVKLENGRICSFQKEGIKVYTVGIGDKDHGGKIPTPAGPPLAYPRDGPPVITRLNERPLRVIAEQTKGTFTLAGTEPPQLVALFRNTIDTGEEMVFDDALRPYSQRYPWFFGVALFFLAAEMMLGRRARQKAVAPKPKSSQPAPTPRASRGLGIPEKVA